MQVHWLVYKRIQYHLMLLALNQGVWKSGSPVWKDRSIFVDFSYSITGFYPSAYHAHKEDSTTSAMTNRRRRRPAASSPLFWTPLLLYLLECQAELHPREEAAGRRRLSQLLRGATPIDINTTRASFSQQNAHTLSLATVPLHATTGTHHVHVYIGSPPQRQTLIVDTGSRLMAFPCQPCRACGKHTSKYFDPSISTTDVVPTCGNCILNSSKCSSFSDHCILSQKYTEGSSWTAFELEDLVWFGTSPENWMHLAVPFTFGCQTSEKGLFQKQYADGILGLAPHESSRMYKMFTVGAIPRNAFSLCFSRMGGQFSLGGTLTHHHLEPMRFSSITQNNGWYSLTVEQVKVGDFLLLKEENAHFFAEGRGTILDSGTTDTFLPVAVAVPLASAWRKWSGLEYSNQPRFYSSREFERLPNVTFSFAGNLTLVMTPNSYMEGVPNTLPWRGKRELTNRIYANEPLGAVLGANAMFGYDILFDVQDQRVGLAPADCSFTAYTRQS